MSFFSSAQHIFGQVFARDGILGRLRGTRRHLAARQAANELRASENRFRSLFDAAPVAIAITRDGVMLYVNAAMVALLGYGSKTEVMGRPVLDFIASPQREEMQQRMAARAVRLEDSVNYETIILREDGEIVPIRVEIASLELADGAATLAFAVDLRPERAAEAQRSALLARERRAALFAARLQQITSELAVSHSVQTVADLIVTRSMATLDARAGTLSMPTAESEIGSDLEIVVARGYAPQILDDYARLPIAPDSPLPAVRALLEDRAIWLENLQQVRRDYPVFSETFEAIGDQAVCVLPLTFENRTLGVLSLSFASAQNFDAETRAFMLTLAAQCAAALERVRLLGQAQGAARLQRESLALLNILLDTAPVGFAFFDLQGRYVLVNHALSRINRVAVADHLGKTVAEILPTVGARWNEMISRVIASGEPSGETEILGLPVGGDSEILHLLVAFYPVRGVMPGAVSDEETAEANEILGVGSVVIDISVRVDAERDRVQLLGELEIERARFEAILQQMPSAVVIAEAPSGRMILGNPQVAEIWRQSYIPSADIAHYDIYRGFHFDGREVEAHEWPLARALEKGEIVRGEEVVVQRGDGSSGVIRLNAAPIRDRDGVITAGVAVFDDVTARARADAAQRFLAEAGSALVATLDERQSYEQLAHLCVPTVTDWCLIAVPGEDGLLSQVAIAHANDDKRALVTAFQAALTSDPQLPWEIGDALRGKRAVLYPEHSVEHLLGLSKNSDFTRFMTQIEAQSAIITPLRARGRVLGLMIWIAAESGRHYDDDDLELADEIGRRAALAATNARLYAEAQSARDEAQNANRAKDEFLAVVSHELRTPLTPILGWLELLRTPDADEQVRAQAYDVIERNARAQAQLINDILDVSRITTGKLRLELKAVALREVVARAVEALRPVANEKNLDLQIELEEVGLALADASRLQQVVWNLLQNALKFTPAGGQVRVSLRQAEDEYVAILEVEDSGAGIESEFLPQVFDRFRQADSSSTRRNGGLGLGLAIVAHIVEGHQGKVSASSAGAGQGATFRVELPLSSPASPESETGAPSSPATRPDLALLPILVVDDEPDTLAMMRVLLESSGALVHVAASAQEALAMWPDSQAEMLISDIAMPAMNGHQLRRELAARGFNAPSIALSAYTAPADVQSALEAGFDAHLSKPIDGEKLIEFIAQMVP